MSDYYQNFDYTYRGNQKLRQIGFKRHYTQQEQDEIKKCADDPIYFIRKYIKVVHVDQGVIPFNMWDFQEKFVRTMHNERFSVAKFPRQVGKTTCTTSYIIWYVLFNPDVYVAILAHKASAARKILAKLQRSYEELPDFLKQNIKIWNKSSVELSNGSKIVADATSPSSIRGDAANLVFLDEFAFIENNIAEEFYESTYPTISSGTTTKLIITSTPRGMNYFYKLYTHALEGKNMFIPLEIKWNDPPGRDDKWREEQIANIGQEKFDQEFGAEFLGSSKTLISGYKLEQLRKMVQPVAHRQNKLDIYELPKNEHRYLITVDVSRGIDKDASAYSVIDITDYPLKQVAKFKDNNIAPLLFPEVIMSTALYYNDAYVLVEINDSGQQIADMLRHELEYENVLMTTRNLKRGGQTISAGHKKNVQYGLRMTTATKKIGCANLKALVEKDRLEIIDTDTVDELVQFVQVRESFAADKGHHDDLVMTLVLLGWAVNQDFFKNTIGKSAREHLAQEYNDEFIPFVFMDDGRTGPFVDESDGTIWVPVV